MRVAFSFLLFAVSGLAAVVSFGGTIAAAGPAYAPPIQVGALSGDLITEASGLATSRRNSNVLWTHNDSGDINRVFAISPAGTLMGTFNLLGATASDYEDIAVGPGPVAGSSYLYVGDIGDNNSVKPSVAVYRVPEPVVAGGGGTTNLSGVENITLVYPDGPRDAESLMIDPMTRDLYIATKTDAGVARFYRAAYPQPTSGSVTLEYLSTFNGLRATAGDISPDGNQVIVRSLSQAFQWTRPAGGSIADAFLTIPDIINLAAENRGESIAFSAPGQTPGFFTVSEGVNQPIYFYATVPEPSGCLCFALAGIVLASRRR